MAIVKMNKFTLFAFEEEKEKLLKKLQQVEEVQFLDLKPKLENEFLENLEFLGETEDILEIENELSKIKFSLNYLKKYKNKENIFKTLKEGKKEITFDELEKKSKGINWFQMYEDIKEKENKQNKIINEIKKMKSETENLIHWANFNGEFKDLNNLKLTTCFLGTIGSNFKNNFIEKIENDLKDVYVEVINEEREDIYLLMIALKKDVSYVDKILKEFGFSKSSINYDGNPNKIIKEYTEKIKNNNLKLQDIENNMKDIVNYEEDLKLVYEYYVNKLNRSKVGSNFLKSKSVLVIQGWNTLESNKKLEEEIKTVANENYYLEFEEPSKDDEVPILLENNGFVEPFESITSMYSLPKYGEIDPTPILSIFYFIFFGMMLSDAGYGLVMVVGTLISLKFFKLDKSTRNFMKLILYLGISTVGWGAVYGGWFGDASQQFLSKTVPYLINPQSQIIFVLGLSCVMGIIHIFVGLGIKGYLILREGKVFDALFDVGLWYVSLIGIFMMISGKFGHLGKILMIVGFVGLVLTQGRDAKTIGGKIGGGIYGLYGITAYIGDIVSYSRLLALGLATGFIANAFNLMINLIPAPFKYIVGPIIFIGGHLFNLGVNALGAYVHSSRLQYLEFFNKFYEGGGKQFIPFKSENKFLNIVKKK